MNSTTWFPFVMPAKAGIQGGGRYV